MAGMTLDIVACKTLLINNGYCVRTFIALGETCSLGVNLCNLSNPTK